MVAQKKPASPSNGGVLIPSKKVERPQIHSCQGNNALPAGSIATRGWPSLEFLPALKSTHQDDLGTLISQIGAAVRTGHHCCQPLMARFGITGTTRASFAAYNTPADVERLVEAVTRAAAMLQ